MASTDGLGFSQHGVWVLRDSVSRAKVPRSRKQKLLILLQVKSQTGTSCFCYILFVNQSQNQPRFKNRRSKSLPLPRNSDIEFAIIIFPNFLSKYLPKFP